MSSYLDIFSSIFQTAVEIWPKRRITSTFLADFVDDMRHYGRVSRDDVVLVFGIAVALTLLRSILASTILTPFAQNMKFTSKNIKKFPESFWKFSYYLVLYIYSCYLLFGKDYPYFEDPRTCWSDWSVGMPVPSDIYYLYCIQASFYIHSIYATVYMDPWRQDSIAMIIHHFLTVFLISFSYAVRYYKVGVVVLFLHDICDVLLEFTKLCVCWKTRNKKQYYWPEVLINIGFILFASSWLFCRLYVFPYKVLHSAGYYAVRVMPHAPFYYFFNGLLLFLFAMNVWWFHFIILLIWRVATGQSSEVEDTREVGLPEDDSLNSEGNTQSSKKSKSNGTQVEKNGNIDGKDQLLAAENNSLVRDLHFRHKQSNRI